MSTFKELKNKVQGIEPETKPIAPKIKPKLTETKENPLTFEPEESRYMLNLIARSDFKGTDVQVVYNIALKLQNIIKESLKETDGIH